MVFLSSEFVACRLSKRIYGCFDFFGSLATYEDRFGMLGSEFCSSFRSAGLEDERRPLRRRLAYVWPRHTEVFALVVDLSNSPSDRELVVLDVPWHRIVSPATLPELANDGSVTLSLTVSRMSMLQDPYLVAHLHVLVGDSVPLVMLDLRV